MIPGPSLRVGLGLATGQVPPGSGRSLSDEYREVPAMARLAEEAGFDSFWVSEHHCANDGHFPSPLLALAAAAAATERIELGTGMLLAPFYHPLRLAEDYAVVSQLARGRLILGLGAGWRRKEFDAYGIGGDERFGRLAESLAVCRAAWVQDAFSFAGRYFTFNDVSVTPKPFAAPRVLLGGTGPRSIRRAAETGDGYLGTGSDVDQFLSCVTLLDQKTMEAGRPGLLPIGFHMNTWVSNDGLIAPPALHAMWHQIGTYRMWHVEDDGQPLAAFPSIDEERIRERTFAGTPADIVEQARPWLEPFRGREVHAIFRLHYPGMSLADARPAIRLFAARVVPALRAMMTPSDK